MMISMNPSEFNLQLRCTEVLSCDASSDSDLMLTLNKLVCLEDIFQYFWRCLVKVLVSRKKWATLSWLFPSGVRILTVLSNFLSSDWFIVFTQLNIYVTWKKTILLNEDTSTLIQSTCFTCTYHLTFNVFTQVMMT